MNFQLINFQKISLFLIVLILSSLSFYFVLAWTEPSAFPPSANVLAPLNVSNISQTKTGDLTVLNLSLGGGGSEGNILKLNQVVGNNDLFIKGNAAETAPVYIAGSQLSFYSGGIERWKIDSGGNLTTGNIPWSKLTSLPPSCPGGQYVTALGSTLTCSTPSGSGDITGVAAGTGLTGGGSSGDVTLSANTTYLQRRVSPGCAVGSSIRVVNEDGTVVCQSDVSGISGSGTTNYISKWTGASSLGNSLIFDNGTNVGIGTTDPGSYKLNVNGTTYLADSVNLVASKWITFGNSGPGGNPGGFKWQMTNDGASMYVSEVTSDQSDYVFKLWDNTTGDRYVWWVADYRGSSYDKYPLIMAGNYANFFNGQMYLNNDTGNVGIGINPPSSRLHIKDGQTFGSDLSIDASGTTGGRRWLIISTGGTATEGQGKFLIKDNTGGVRLTIDTNGYVGIGITGPSEKLDVSGNVKATGFCIGASCITSWSGFGKYTGSTPGSYNGNQGGYTGAKALCNSAFSGSHVCTVEEILYSINSGKTIPFSGEGWVSGGPPGYTAEANDCGGWTKSGPELGRIWFFTSTGGYGRLTNCSAPVSFICCK